MNSYLYNYNKGIYKTDRLFIFLIKMLDKIDVDNYPEYLQLIYQCLGKLFMIEFAKFVSKFSKRLYVILFFKHNY